MTYEPPASPPDETDRDAYFEYCEWLGTHHLPGWVTAMPVWTEQMTICPYCALLFTGDAVPKRGGPCPRCGDEFRIRTCLDGVRRTLTKGAWIEHACCVAETNPNMTMVEISIHDDPAEAAAERAATMRKLRLSARNYVLELHGRPRITG